MKYVFQSGFAEHINNLLDYRSAMGFSTNWYRRDLAIFDRFCLKNFPGESCLTKEIAFAWCNDVHSKSGYRVKTIRGFGKYLISSGIDAFIVPSSFLPHRKADPPHIFTENELRRFFEAADHFHSCSVSPIIEYTIPTIFRLQYACGLRPQEIRLLLRADVNFTDATVYIAKGKHYKERKLAVEFNVMAMCSKYDQIAEIITPGRTYFFQAPSGGCYSNYWLIDRFQQCWELSGNGNVRGTCTPYTLRHNYATQTLMRWVEEGKDLNAWIPYLSAYMGHNSFSSTFYYIHLLPDRLARMDFTRTSGIIPEVHYEEE